MRPLTEEESKTFFEKLNKYIGENVRLLLERSDGTYCFRFHRDRVYYCKEEIMKKAAHFPRKDLISFGTCFGKFSKTRIFRLNVTALEFLAPYAKHKVWLKPSAEQQVNYILHIIK
jgi:60S ribosome subunit biogenesis protein NIP7